MPSTLDPIISAIVARVWRELFHRTTVTTDAERCLHAHLAATAVAHKTKLDEDPEASPEGFSEGRLVLMLLEDAHEKLQYMCPTWGDIDATAIVSQVDECAIALQAQTKKDFLDPLNWDVLPHAVVIATTRAVLLLFGLRAPSHCTDEEIWRNHWGLWIVKNVDAHTGGWEWIATNEPTGLFTKPYALHDEFLPQVRRLLEGTRKAAPTAEHRHWHRLGAYACLRDWAEACVAYVHMRRHHLEGFPAHGDVQRLLQPPRRTPQANVWFRLETKEGIEYFYNRLTQRVVLGRPEDFDGQNVTTIPNVVHELIQEALAEDHATRLELERLGRQRVHAKLLAEDEWVECIDYHTQRPFYYNFTHYRVSSTPPPSGVFLTASESVAYRAVVRLQTAYRKRRLQQRLQIKRTKRASLPVFSAFSTNNKKFY